ncbi:MAG: hypothetical protein OXK79_06925 [Chloroflexota bacterium]|nr:hypothetical protein [Chloroflexota bacterium]
MDVSIALEVSYDLPRWGVTQALEDRVSGFLATGRESRGRIGRNAGAFYDARSAIVYGRSVQGSPFATGAAFVSGFDLARWSLFKKLREGAPEDRTTATGDGNEARGPGRQASGRSRNTRDTSVGMSKDRRRPSGGHSDEVNSARGMNVQDNGPQPRYDTKHHNGGHTCPRGLP